MRAEKEVFEILEYLLYSCEMVHIVKEAFENLYLIKIS